MRIPFKRNSTGAVLVHPLFPVPRTAVLEQGFRDSGQIRTFPTGWNRAAERFRPEAVAGSFPALLQLASAKVEIRHSVIVFTWDLECPLTDKARDLLWRAFEVPIFEQVLSADCELVAAECEAHAGLHLVKDGITADLTGWRRVACHCGDLRPLLLPAEPARVMAATA